VTVNAVCPGYVMTELIEKQLANQAKTRGIPKARRCTGAGAGPARLPCALFPVTLRPCAQVGGPYLALG
jgi:NAD(P)-dependent dehydrogenase (short-subunit alcohol dehydrogenase family)